MAAILYVFESGEADNDARGEMDQIPQLGSNGCHSCLACCLKR